jgi:hypothetical protein
MRKPGPSERLLRMIYPGRLAKVARSTVGFAGKRVRDDHDETSFWARVTIAADQIFDYLTARQMWRWRR